MDVNFVEYCIVDTTRQELYPHFVNNPFRQCMMHVWIPCSEQKQQFPLILFSHGLGGTYNGMTYTALCKHIASSGYVVASVSHTYGCKPVQFPDGTQSPYLFPTRAVHFLQGRHMFDIETDMWTDDMICALNECIRYNTCEHDLLYKTIDISRVGIIGHSLGGSTALQVCRKDSRVLTAINLDGPLYGTNAEIPFYKPILFIFGSSVLPGQITLQGKVPNHYQFLWRSIFNRIWLPDLNTFIASLSQAENVVIDGILHDTFSDYAFTTPLMIQPWLIDGAQAQNMIAVYVIDFLNRCLK
jgi:dienelactone hydrolase